MAPNAKKPTLRAALLEKLKNPDRRRLHELAKAARKRYGPMSKDETYAVLADEHDIPVHKFLVGDDLTRVRGIIAAGAATGRAATTNGRQRPGKAQAVVKEIVIDGARFVTDDPILPPQVADDAKRMAGVYPLTYVFENSVRELVVRVMQKKYGTDWWRQPMVPRSVLRNVEANKRNEASIPWHGSRGTHDIHYTTIDDLITIINANLNWPLFQPILGNQNAIQFLIQVIERSRHTIAHHNPLSPDDVTALKVNVRAWQKLLRERKHLI